MDGGWERRIEAFVKIPKKKKITRGGGGWEGRGPIRVWDGGGGGSKVWGRWGMGDVNQE